MPTDVCIKITKLYDNINLMKEIVEKFNKMSWMTIIISTVSLVISLTNINQPNMKTMLIFSSLLMIVSICSFILNITNERIYDKVHSVNSVFFVMDCKKNIAHSDSIAYIKFINDNVKKFVKLFILSFFINFISVFIMTGFFLAIVSYVLK